MITFFYPAYWSFLFYNKRIPELYEDLNHWKDNINESDKETFFRCFKIPEFRNVFYYRLPLGIRSIFKIIWPRMNQCYIHTTKIGGGLRIYHGFSCMISAEQIGKNFVFYQNVTVGWEKTGRPTIGDNVKIYTGAVVSGGIRIGDNVIITANTFVRKDVPPNTLVYGNPAKFKNINT